MGAFALGTTSYSDEEVKQILESLFIEKKRLKDMQRSFLELESEKNKLKDELKQTKTAVKEQYEGSQHTQEDINKLKGLVEYYQKKYAAADNKPSQETQEKLQSLQELLREQQEENKLLAAQLQNLKSDKKNVDAKIDSLEKNFQQLSSAKENLENEYHQIQKAYEKTLNETRTLRSEINQENSQAHSQKIEILEKEISTLKEELNHSKNSLTQAGNTLMQLRQDNQSLKLQNSDLQQKFQATEKKAAGFESDLKELVERYHELDHRQKQRQEKLAESLQDKEKELKELHGFELAYKKLSEQKKAIETEFESNKTVLNNLKRELTDTHTQLSETQLRAEQLEKGIQYLRSKLDEANTDKSLLEDELVAAQESERQKSNDLIQITELKNTLETELQQTQFEKAELDEEIDNLRNQYESLRQIAQNAQLQSQEKDLQINQLQHELQEQKAVQNLLQRELNDRISILDSLNNQLFQMQNEIKQGSLEAKELESLYLSVLEEKMSAINTLQDQQRIVRELKEEVQLQIEAKRALQESQRQDNLQLNDLKRQLERLQSLENDKKQLNEKIHLFEQQMERVSYQLEEQVREKADLENRLLKSKEQMRDRDQALENKTSQILLLTQENQRLQESFLKQQNQSEERDNQTRQAQQQFAKKVKECAILMDQLEEARAQLNDIFSQNQAAELKVAEMRQQLEAAQLQEKRIHDQAIDNIRLAEQQTAKWEEKYLKLFKFSQELENKNKELKRIEERFHQMQSIFSPATAAATLYDSLTTSPLELPKEERPLPEIKEEEKKEEKYSFDRAPKITESYSEPKEKESFFAAPPAHDLFGDKQQAQKPKQTLFDNF